MKIDKRALISFCAVLALIIAFQFLVQKRENEDVVFCRNLYTRLAKGSSSVDPLIDWDNLTVLGYNVGMRYHEVPPNARRHFRNTFIQGFGAGFIAFKGKLDYFKNWRLYNESDDKAVIACDYPRMKKTLLFTIAKKGEAKKLIAIDWRK